jgi:hypothetical protein
MDRLHGDPHMPLVNQIWLILERYGFKSFVVLALFFLINNNSDMSWLLNGVNFSDFISDNIRKGCSLGRLVIIYDHFRFAECSNSLGFTLDNIFHHELGWFNRGYTGAHSYCIRIKKGLDEFGRDTGQNGTYRVLLHGFKESSLFKIFYAGDFKVSEKSCIVYVFEGVHIPPSYGDINFDVKIV